MVGFCISGIDSSKDSQNLDTSLVCSMLLFFNRFKYVFSSSATFSMINNLAKSHCFNEALLLFNLFICIVFCKV